MHIKIICIIHEQLKCIINCLNYVVTFFFAVELNVFRLLIYLHNITIFVGFIFITLIKMSVEITSHNRTCTCEIILRSLH